MRLSDFFEKFSQKNFIKKFYKKSFSILIKQKK